MLLAMFLVSSAPTLATVTLLLATVEYVIAADPNDWVNVKYVLQQSQVASSGRSETADAQTSIMGGAVTTARNGPWTVANSKGVVAPSRDPHDYLSWAPYHWPNCNWCSGERTNIAHTNTTDEGDNGDSENGSDGASTPSGSDPGYEDEDQDDVVLSVDHSSQFAAVFGRSSSDNPLDIPQVPVGGPPPIPTQVLTATPTQSAVGTPTSDGASEGTPTLAQAPAKTQKGGKSSCTPSPASSMPPSATWTTCPYVPRDGQVNPDVRSLNAPDAITGVSQSVLYNAIAFVLRKSAVSSQNVAHFIDTFFLSSSTKMNPNMKFGQVVRGPGEAGQSGTFTGILDLRGIVKVVNAVLMIKAADSPDWTAQRDKELNDWMLQYVAWLQNSDLGKKASSSPNNHATFFVSQLAAINLLTGDTQDSASVLQNYFSAQFLDQIAASGEQPFEAVRTRPFHYRCFNLEAMITNAKLGDQLGLNLWVKKSKYGATIQTAVDFTMSLDPKEEDVTEILPHIATVAAAYGDPKGKYAAFLKKTMASYQGKPFWFYDQTVALSNSPAAQMHKRSPIWAREDSVGLASNDAEQPTEFVCPSVFDVMQQVEIDDGVFVTCDELRPFYELPVPVV